MGCKVTFQRNHKHKVQTNIVRSTKMVTNHWMKIFCYLNLIKRQKETNFPEVFFLSFNNAVEWSCQLADDVSSSGIPIRINWWNATTLRYIKQFCNYSIMQWNFIYLNWKKTEESSVNNAKHFVLPYTKIIFYSAILFIIFRCARGCTHSVAIQCNLLPSFTIFFFFFFFFQCELSVISINQDKSK